MTTLADQKEPEVARRGAAVTAGRNVSCCLKNSEWVACRCNWCAPALELTGCQCRLCKPVLACEIITKGRRRRHVISAGLAVAFWAAAVLCATYVFAAAVLP